MNAAAAGTLKPPPPPLPRQGRRQTESSPFDRSTATARHQRILRSYHCYDGHCANTAAKQNFETFRLDDANKNSLVFMSFFSFENTSVIQIIHASFMQHSPGHIKLSSGSLTLLISYNVAATCTVI